MSAFEDALEDAVQLAMAEPGIASAAIFVRRSGTDSLDLGAAAGVAGVALERLVAAVQDPGHPITRTLIEDVASFDVTPIAPGGPALRSHIPLPGASDRAPASGVLAVAHELPLDVQARDALTAIAHRASAVTY